MQNTQQISATQDRPNRATPRAHRLKSISVIGGFLDGVRLDLADGLNCIIGARGTGKTTTLELLRYAIAAMPSRETHGSEYRRIESLVQQNLAGGRVEVEVETKDGLHYTISRTWGEEPIVMTTDGTPTAISLAGSGIFKADVFSQNEVEGIADRPASQLALLDNFEAEAIAQIESEIRQLQSTLSANASQIVPLQNQLTALSDELSTLPGVEEKLKKFSTADNEDSTAINRAHALKALRDRERRAVESATEILHVAARGLAALSGRIGQEGTSLVGADIAAGPNGPLLQEITGGLLECGQEVDRLVEQARSCIAGHQDDLTQRATALATVHKEQELAFRSVIEQHKQAQGEAAERAQLERLRNDLLAKERLLVETAERLQDLQSDRFEMLARLSELRDERFAIREDVVRRINEALSPAIRVRIVQHGNAERYLRLLENGLRGARIKHGIVAQKLAGALWPAELAEIVRQGDVAVLIDKAELNATQAEKVMTALGGSELLFDLETVDLMDRPRIELKDGSTYKDSLSLSTGQKCTSILPILLLDSENPLLVDQPEDNLDNGFIYGTIVDSIRKIKARRQLIFVTHNPNVPVLGDAEGVFVLASNGASSRVVGAGSVDDCKSHIVSLLEGGEDAFRMRGERYAQ